MEKRLNFLFLGGAKRVAIGRMLLDAGRRLGVEAAITGYELDSHSAIAAIGTVEEGLRWSDPGIYSDIDRVVDARGIDVIIPFVDPAVGIAAEYRRRCGGAVFVPCGQADACAVMFDKIGAAALFERLGIPIPRTYRAGDPATGLIAKPRYGSASRGIFPIDSLSELYAIRAHADKYLIQKRIDHREEITVDCYAGVGDGRIYACSPRLRGEVCGGEAVRTETIADEACVALASRVIECCNLRGAVTVQLIRDLDTGSLMVMEVNPRLGGACVASVHAGADIPALIIADALGLPVEEMTAVPGVETVRYLEDVVFK